jgi:hypothetical protein
LMGTEYKTRKQTLTAAHFSFLSPHVPLSPGSFFVLGRLPCALSTHRTSTPFRHLVFLYNALLFLFQATSTIPDMHFTASLFAPLALALSAAAHGYLGTMTIDGKAYKGNGDGGDPSSTVIRPTKPNDVGPVKGASNPDIKCGLSPVSDAKLIATAKPGSDIDVLWVGQGGGNVS